MIHLVTFASDDMSKSADLCVSSALRMGVDDAWAWTAKGFQFTPLYWPNRLLLSQPRGCGYWTWKPFIIYRALEELSESADYIIYSDAGVEFIEPVHTVIDLMDQDIWLFGNEHLHAHWCKRDIVEAIWPPLFVDKKLHEWIIDFEDPTWSRFGKQVQASVIFFRVNDYTRAFVKEWLDWCLFENGRLIDDSPSRTPNHPEFRENRHDQAILTTMAYRDGIKLHEWFVKYEGYTPGRMTGYPRELERPFVFHHRRRNSEWEGVAA